VGTAYDLHGQGVPLILPIDRNAAVKAVTTDSKINEGLYESLGVDTKKLKKTISSEITRGIASGMPHSDIAKNIARYAKAPLGRAKTIVRTESHRIQQASKLDAQKAAKAKGANIVKQWNSTLDGDTRPSHRKLDGKFADVDGFFEMDGKKARYPGDFGDPAEDCNCRCQLLQRARAALDEDELKALEERAKFFGLDKSDDLEDFKKKYLNAAENVELPLEKSVKSGKMIVGAKGAYNSRNDPDGKKREAHADRYYESVRNGKKQPVVDAISQNSNVSAEYVSKMFDHLFVNEYDLDKGHVRFDTDYDIAESVQRLRDGKNIQEHDLILIYHEAMEHDLMNNDGLGYEEAHERANIAFNYQKALDLWLDELEK
jgi:SPP1 gp7 family putative phage head morphogenesis protein